MTTKNFLISVYHHKERRRLLFPEGPSVKDSCHLLLTALCQSLSSSLYSDSSVFVFHSRRKEVSKSGERTLSFLVFFFLNSEK